VIHVEEDLESNVTQQTSPHWNNISTTGDWMGTTQGIRREKFEKAHGLSSSDDSANYDDDPPPTKP